MKKEEIIHEVLKLTARVGKTHDESIKICAILGIPKEETIQFMAKLGFYREETKKMNLPKVKKKKGKNCQ